MITLEAHSIYLLIASNAVLLALACLSVMKFERRCRRLEKFWASPTGAALSDDERPDSDAQIRATARLERRLGELQRTVKCIEIKKTAPKAPTVERQLPIENAVRMAKRGASIDDLTKSCGLNIGEARLMQKLHGQAPAHATGKG